jgi:hypothetical protein
MATALPAAAWAAWAAWTSKEVFASAELSPYGEPAARRSQKSESPAAMRGFFYVESRRQRLDRPMPKASIRDSRLPQKFQAGNAETLLVIDARRRP